MSCTKAGSGVRLKKEIIEYGLEHRPGNPLSDPEEVATIDKITGGGYFPDDILKNSRMYFPDAGNPGADEVVQILQRAQGNPEMEVTIYRGAPSRGVLNSGDWVTLSKSYAEQFAGAGSYSDNPNSKVYKYKAKAKELSFDGDSIFEFGYWRKRQKA